jgi:hypothetical protein
MYIPNKIDGGIMEDIKLHSVKNLRGGYFVPEFIDKKFITQDGNLGVNVKDYNTRMSPLLDGQMYFNYELNDYVYSGVQVMFWNKCQSIGHSWGYDHVENSGRSGGWACPMNIHSYDSSTTFNYIKCPENNLLSDISIADAIKIQRFNGFAKYVQTLFFLVKSEIGHITNIDEFFELKKEVESL